MTKTKRTTAERTIKGQYLQFFTFLFQEPFLSGLSSHAKVLYTLFHNRTNLSRKNKWVNQAGEIYTIFTREEIGKLLGISASSATKVVRELIRVGLLEEEIHQGHASRFYLLAPEEQLQAACQPSPAASWCSPEHEPEQLESPRGTPVEFEGDPRKSEGGTPVKFTAEYNNIRDISKREYPSIDHREMDQTNDPCNLDFHQDYYARKIEEIDNSLADCYQERAAMPESQSAEMFARIDRLYRQRDEFCHLQVDYTALPLCEVEERIQEQIDYEALTGVQGSCAGDRALVDSIVSVVAQELHQKGLGATTRERLLRLSAEQVETIVESVLAYQKPIRNPKRFLERCVLNAAVSQGALSANRMALCC